MTVDREFVRETDDAVRQLTVELVDLEGSADRETLDEAFRRTHALKGNLGMVGLEEARDLAHALEDVLDAIRAGDRPADRAAIDAALDAADEIGRAVERAHRGEPAPDLAQLTDRLRSLADETDVDAPSPSPAGDGDETGVDGADNREDETDADSRANEPEDDSADEMEAAGFVFEPAGESADETDDAGADGGEPEFDDEVQAALDDASEFDDLDALVEEVDDAGEFDDLEGGGSFDDVLDEDPEAGLDGATDDEGPEEPPADDGPGPVEDEGLDLLDDLGLGTNVDGPESDVGDGLGEIAGDAFDDPTGDVLDDPTGDISDDPAADVEGEPTEDDDATVAPDGEPGETGAEADAPPASPGGAFDEFQEIQQEVDRDDDLDQLQQDIEETDFGEFDDEDDMTIDELLMTELDDSSAEAESATAGGAFDESAEADPATDERTAEAEAPVDDATSEPGPEPEPEPEPAVERVDEPTAADEGPDPVDADVAAADPADEVPVEGEPTTADVDPAIREVPDADATTVEASVRELPDEEAEPEPEPEPANVPVETTDETAAAASDLEPAIRELSEPAVREISDPEPASAEHEDYEPAITPVEPAAADSEPTAEADGESVVEADVEPAVEGIPEPAIEEVSDPASADASAGPADASASEEPPTDDGVESEPVAGEGDEGLDPEVEALLSEVEVSGSEASADASFESDAADTGVGEGLSGFRRDEAADAFEARFGDLFAAEADAGGSDAPTVPSIADSDLDASAFADDADGERSLPARQRTTAPASLSVDPDVGDELLRQVRELAAASRRLAAAADRTNPAVRDALSALQSATDDVRQTALEVRLMPLSTVTDGFGRVVRDVARDAGVEVSFETHGTDVHLDRDVLDRIGDPLVHLVRNAVDHGIEPPEEREAAGKPREGTVELRARREGDAATIEVRDDGSGLDPEALRETAIEEGLVTEGEAAALSRAETFDLLFEPGFSTTDEVTETSGRGVGMDAVARAVSELGGSVAVESEPAEGTTVRLSVPVTVAVAEVVFLEVGAEQYAVPTADVESVQYATETVVEDGEVRVPTADGERSYPLVRLGEALDAADEGGERVVVRVDPDVRGVALGADDVGEKREVVITPYEDVLGETPGIGGATLLEDNTVVNVIDVETL